MQIEEVNLTIKVLNDIKKLDDNFYGPDIFAMDYYTQRYTPNNKAIVLKNEKTEIVGYLIISPIKKEYFETLYNGVITNDLYVNPKMYLAKSNYIYLNSIVIAKQYQNQGYGSKIMEIALKNIQKGIALVISQGGYNLAKKFLKEHLKIDNKTYIFITK